MSQDWITLMQNQSRLAAVLKTNETTEQYGLALTRQNAELILQERGHALREQRRVEFGAGIAEKIIYEFCDYAYIDQNSYVDTIVRLQDIFYLYKNEMHDEITDDELLHLMKEQFEMLCFGDLDYLEGTCLENFAEAVRAGYDGCRDSEGYGEYARFDPVQRWDYDLYLETLKELCWR